MAPIGDRSGRFGEVAEGARSDSGNGEFEDRIGSALKENPSSLFQTMKLPNEEYKDLWANTHVDETIRIQLANALHLQAKFQGGPGIEKSLRGLIILHGGPGGGKTSLARGGANFYANCVKQLYGETVLLMYLQSSSFFSEHLGQSAKSIRTAVETISFVMNRTRVIVLADELESIAMDRRKFGAGDPTDLHRFTNEFLTALDRLLTHPNFLFIGTSNYSGAIDPAVIDRADLILRIDFPNRKAAEAILLNAARHDQSYGIRVSREVIEQLVGVLYAKPKRPPGLSGRDLRKLLVRAVLHYGKLELRLEHLLGVTQEIITRRSENGHA